MDVFVIMFVVMSMTMLVRMSVRMDRPFRAAKETARFVGREVWNDFSTGHKLIHDTWKRVSLHDRRHHLVIDRKGHEHPVPFDDRGPVLVAESMSEFDTSPDHFLRA